MRVSAKNEPATYHLIDYTRGTADLVGEEYPQLTGVTLGEVRSISYQATDGYRIPAYLTLPAGKEAKNLPLVVLPHDGPRARDEPGFHWQSTISGVTRLRDIAAAVSRLVPLRVGTARMPVMASGAGSCRYDVTDGVNAMVKQGIADRQRICIVGVGYAGLRRARRRSVQSRLVRLRGQHQRHLRFADAAQIRSSLDHGLGEDLLLAKSPVGAPTDEHVIARSPARAASRIQAPILLLHSGMDSVVAPDQSKRDGSRAANRRQAGTIRDTTGRGSLVETSGLAHSSP